MAEKASYCQIWHSANGAKLLSKVALRLLAQTRIMHDAPVILGTAKFVRHHTRTAMARPGSKTFFALSQRAARCQKTVRHCIMHAAVIDTTAGTTTGPHVPRQLTTSKARRHEKFLASRVISRFPMRVKRTFLGEQATPSSYVAREKSTPSRAFANQCTNDTVI